MTLRAPFAATALLVATALLAGGTSAAFNHLFVQLASLPLFALLVAKRTRPTLPVKFVLVALGFAALQLVPLPPAIWTSTAGGSEAARVLVAAGLPLGWRPLALDPGAAAMALSTIAAPLILLAGTSVLDAAERRRLLVGVALFAGASAVLGIFQKLAGGLALYPGPHSGNSIGMMANRNHHSDLIISGILLLPLGVPPVRRRQLALALTVVVAGMAVSVLATISRIGMALALPGLLASIAMIWRLRLRWVAAAAGVLALGAALVAQLPSYAPIVARFAGAAEDERLTIAGNTLVAIRQFWPWGSGYGSFVPVYAAFEDLDLTHSLKVIAAHNDYLQIVLEGGAGGLFTLAGALALVGWTGWRLLATKAGADGWAPFGVVVVLLVHSGFDFPLRMAALSCVFALCLGVADATHREIAKDGNST